MSDPNYMGELEALERSIPERYAEVRDAQGFRELTTEFFGPEGSIVGLMMTLMELPLSERVSFGSAISRVTQAVKKAQEECLKRLKAS